MDYFRKRSSLYHRSDYCDWKLTCLYWSCESHEKLPNCDPLSSCHSRSFLTLAILTLPIQLIFTDFWLLKNLSTGRTSSHVFKNTFLDIKTPYKLGKTQRLMAEHLARASGALRKFGKLSTLLVLRGREGNQVSARQMEGYVMFSWREIAQDDGVAIFVAYKNMLIVNFKKPYGFCDRSAQFLVNCSQKLPNSTYLLISEEQKWCERRERQGATINSRRASEEVHCRKFRQHLRLFFWKLKVTEFCVIGVMFWCF